MKKSIKRFFLFGLVVILSSFVMSCDVPLTFELGELFSLACQQTKKNAAEDISITFEKVVADSRCPSDVLCVWAGNAEVLFTFTKGAESATFSLNTHLDPREMEVLGYLVKMVGLKPTKILSTDPPEQTDYVASMIITKIDTQACKDNLDCSKSEFCKKAVGDCDGLGQCAVRPEICLAISDPQCGCDGVTYGSECEAASQGINIAREGKCRDTHCDDGSQLVCKMMEPVCDESEIAAIQDGCWVCVNPKTCLPWGEPQCKTDKDCKSGICYFCGTSSCAVCEDCIPACVEK